uniref:Cullin-2 n=1 Tax=Elaeophora elaphi TaxID=1147741 RepID=A0A0R3S5F6_9BILA
MLVISVMNIVTPESDSAVQMSQYQCSFYSLRPKQVDFDATWRSVENSIKRIMKLQPLERRVWDYNFYDIYSLCVAIPEPLSGRLYKKTKECLEAHVTELHQVLMVFNGSVYFIKEISSANDSELLNVYCQLWNIYYKGALCVHNLFGYLNKQYIKIKRCTEIEGGYGAYGQYLTQKDVKEIGLLAMEIWRKKLIDPMEKRLVDHVLSAIAADREGRNNVPVDIVRGAIMSFVQVDDVDSMREVLDRSPSNLPQNYETYREMFEKKFLQTTTEYYTVLSIKLLSELSCSQYMESVITRIEEENERSIRFLHKSSHEKVTKLCQDVMVDAHKERLYAVCHEYIEGECMNDLHNMYRILKPINGGLSVVIREFQNFVQKTGLEVVKDMRGDNIPQQFVENVLQVYNRFSSMVAKVYYDDGDFVGALDKALQAVVNYREDPRQIPKASERLARYTDTLLRKSGKGLSDSELDTKLSQAIIIFRYIEDKDIFQKFYSKMLANRLIGNASLSKDAEESMISKLKQACGFEFTSKLSRMFTDVGLSNELTDKFISHCAVSNVTLNVQMTVLILQAGAWPLSAPSSTPVSSADGKDSTAAVQTTGFIIPPILLPSIEHFEKYYQASHNGRKLTWLFNLASVEVKLHYLDKVYQVTMSAHQLAILFCFETKDLVTLSYIEKATGLSDELLSRNARALVDSGVLIMANKEMKEDSEVALNLTLTSKRLRFKVLVPQLQRHIEKEAEHVNITAQQDRKYYMECTIVRIMKTRKVLKHAALVNEVIEQTKSRFIPDVNFIKKNIESLIEKLYIQRTDLNDEYQYLA